jgi:hypothetical protein
VGRRSRHTRRTPSKGFIEIHRFVQERDNGALVDLVDRFVDLVEDDLVGSVG